MDLQRACKQLLIKSPFYGLFLLSLNKYFSNKDNPTARVVRDGINCALEINSDFWSKLNDSQQLAILQHEIMHILFKHLFMFESFDDPSLFNYAADCEVNSYIENLPEGCVLAEKFGLENKMGTKYYYEKLSKLKDSLKDLMKKVLSGTNIGSSPNMDGDGNILNHDSWKDFKGLTDVEKELISNQIDYNAKQVAEQIEKSRGLIPNELTEYINTLLKKECGFFDWKKQLRRMLGNEIDIQLKKTHNKESFRFSGMPGVKHKKKIKVLVGIDTSGSVSTKELEDFISEIYFIYKAGANVDICEIDASIHRMYPFKGKFDGKITGRGGTEFNPLFDYFFLHRSNYEKLIMFTDGYCGLNFTHPTNNVIWIITKNGKHTEYPGQVLYIPDIVKK